MNCPKCVGVTLAISQRHGVEIDYCPQCRGVWLDREELDKIIDREVSYSGRDFRRDSRDDDDDDRRRHDDRYDGRRKKSFWSELFD
jgi:uncharacterized protein